MASSASGSPCGACKFLRRKCASDCIFAPYFCFDQAHSQFAAIHKIFGASNVSKLLLHVPASDRCEAVVTIAYEAEARLRDPVYGCVAHIFALQQQVAILQAQLMQVKAQIAHNIAGSRPSGRDQWQADAVDPSVHSCSSAQPMQLKRSVDCMEYYSQMQEEMDYEDGCANRHCAKRRTPHELGELQAMALRMMRS